MTDCDLCKNKDVNISKEIKIFRSITVNICTNCYTSYKMNEDNISIPMMALYRVMDAKIDKIIEALQTIDVLFKI